MNAFNPYSLQQDSLQNDSLSGLGIKQETQALTDSTGRVNSGKLQTTQIKYLNQDTDRHHVKQILAVKANKPVDQVFIDTTSESIKVKSASENSEKILKQYSFPVIERITFYGDSAKQINYQPFTYWAVKEPKKDVANSINLIHHSYQRSQYNWALVIGFFGILLLLGLKTYYQKFVNQVFNTLVNFQLADKMLREKNILVRRAFFMMNVNFVLIFGLFIELLSDIFGISITSSTILNYTIFVAIIIAFLLIRLLILYSMATIFNSLQAVTEHVHISYLVNKNLGLIFLPLVFASIYTTGFISRFLLFTGVVIFILANIYKLIRSFQIILRNGILLYHAILYLCTLELLPLAIGIKILTSLR
jgi:hypothetical protein